MRHWVGSLVGVSSYAVQHMLLYQWKYALNLLLVEVKVAELSVWCPASVPRCLLWQWHNHRVTLAIGLSESSKLPPWVLDRTEPSTELCVMSCHVLLKSFTQRYLRHMTQVHERSWSDSNKRANSWVVSDTPTLCSTWGWVVLLIELMDSSLTRFLEQSEEPLPFHIQLNQWYL